MAIEIEDQLQPLLAGRRPVRAYGPGRTCAFSGCGTQLSVYNANDRCWAHVRAPVDQSDRPQTTTTH